MTKEYGVACLLKKESANILLEKIPFLDRENIPHISLFQFSCEDMKFLSDLSEYISNIFISTEFITSGISLSENNIFMNIFNDSTLRNASNEITNFYAMHCTSKKPLSQINIANLNSDEIALVKDFGIYWVKHNFSPHVTLTYNNKKLSGNLNIRIPESISIDRVNIYEIDALGRITKSERC